MLEDYILEYAKALRTNDEEEQRRIEDELATVGMDKMTLYILAKEYEKEEGESKNA